MITTPMATLRYQDVYPSTPAVDSSDVARRSAAELPTLEYFVADPGQMPTAVFGQHHVLLNLKEEPHRVENWRDGEHRDFVFRVNEVIVTPAGVASGWRWHEQSQVIVITLEPDRLERFARQELGIALSKQQLVDQPQFLDPELVQAGRSLVDALQAKLGSAVMFESLARVFLVKLLQRYGDQEPDASDSLPTDRFRRVLDYVASNFGKSITVEDLAEQAGVSAYHFSRLFKRSVGQSPYQFLMAYRIERAKSLLGRPDTALIDIAHTCGFSDQAHFSRAFKRSTGTTPKAWRLGE